ncbi:unnamed protein product [Triticum turgidum subsp. durum]|uniref:Major facilitator superfamily (MFS) profile domain-containing protein n=1 Tax=Triticum turgidum subsp. durum TaxID=4567 RepID=A0A9R0X7J5_TRITD|nr:unnamed protein product [Triticum turgidum subsp. durum]
MAGGFAGVEAGGGRAEQYEGRITPYFILACIVGSFGGSLFGYDLGVSSGVTSMDDFLIKFFPDVYDRKHAHLHETDYCKYDNQVLTLFTSSLYFAGLVSTFGASYVTKRHGRRGSIMVGAVSFFLGGAVNAAAVNVAMLIVGRVLLGVGIGFGNQAVPLYLSEIAPFKIRGAVNQLFQLTTCLGILVANVINYFTDRIHPWGWRLSLGLAVVPATAIFVGALFLPETPNSLVERGRLEEARRVLEKVRGTHKVDAEFEDLKEASEAARAVRGTFRNLLAVRNRPQLIIGALGIPAFQQLSGMNSILFYSPVIFQSLGFGSSAALYSSIITGSMLVVGALVSMVVVDRLGRRVLFIEAGARGGAVQGREHGAGGGHLLVRGGVRVVVGAAGVAGAERVVPAGDAVGGAERGGVREPVLDGGGGAVLPGGHVPPPVGGVHPLRGAHRGHVHLRHPAAAGDEAGAHRGDLAAVRQALVLEAGRHQGPQVPGPPPTPGNGRRRLRRQARRHVGIDRYMMRVLIRFTMHWCIGRARNCFQSGAIILDR